MKTITTAIALLLMTLTTTIQAVDEKKKAVRFIYFIEKGESYSQKDYDAIKKQAFTLQKYWNFRSTLFRTCGS
jgi:hypothetical protein